MPQRLSIPKVKSKMQSLGLNTAKLVVKSQLSESTIDRILHGRATNYSEFTLQRLASALECSVLELLDDESTSAALTAFSTHSVENVVAVAAAENVTAVVEAVAPDVPAEVVAESMPTTPVAIPSALDVAAYFEQIKEQRASEVAGLQDHIQELRTERDIWRWLCLILGMLLMAVLLWKGLS